MGCAGGGWSGSGLARCFGLCVGRGQARARPPPRLLEFLGLARCIGFAGGKRSSPEAQQSGEGSEGMSGVCFFGSVCWICGREEVKETSPDIEGQPATKIPKIPKIPIVVDLLGSCTNSRNTSREQTYNQTEKKIIRLYIIVNDC